MITHLNGILEHIDQGKIVLDVQGIGYQVKVPAAVLAALPPVGKPLKIFTVQVVREDDISLYGFLEKEQRALFSLFLSVSGIGPKLALSLLSAFTPDKLAAAIAGGDVALLSSISGIGRKTAERIVVELKDKIAKAYGLKPGEMLPGGQVAQPLLADALSALLALGYSPKEAREALAKSDLTSAGSIEEIIKQVLKNLA